MKLTQSTLLLACAGLLSACATSSATKQGGALSIQVRDVDAHIGLAQRTSGTAEISTFQIFGLKFHSDASGKRFSGQTSNLVVPGYAVAPSPNVSTFPGEALLTGALGNVGGIAKDPLYFLFGSPATREGALSAARNEAVEKSEADGIIETKAKVDTTGFSLLGLIGWGTASASVEGQGVKISKGTLYRGHVVLERP
jgi:hypothetical protein